MTKPSTTYPETRQAYKQVKHLMNFSEVRRLAYSLMSMQQKKRFHTLSVLSCFPAEGKTLFCAAMAMAYAETTGSRVLVVDTDTSHNPNSLVLRDCLDPMMAQVDFLSLSNRHPEYNGVHHPTVDARMARERNATDTIVLEKEPTSVLMTRESDHSLINKVMVEGSQKYNLVLLDTVALNTRNKHNLDPYLTASLSDASVLIVSPKLLNTPALQASIKVLKSPELHLVGVVSNEEFLR